MRDWIRLGRIADIEIGMELSVLAVVAIVAFGLASGRFPAVFPGRSIPEYLFAAITGVYCTWL